MTAFTGGVDEAGRGPLVGPMVVAGVALPADKIAVLLELGVTDSKKLTPKRREALDTKLRAIPEIRIVELVISPDEIDRAVGNASVSLNGLTLTRMAEAIERLSADEVYIDLVGQNPDRHVLALSRLLTCPPRIYSSAKADALYPITGAASIIAKVRRDREIAAMNSLFLDRYGPIGSGYPGDPATREFLRLAWREEGIFRRSWSSYRNWCHTLTT